MKHLKLLAVLAVLGCASHPTVDRTPSQALNLGADVSREFVDELKKILTPHLVQLDRTMDTFHYESGDPQVTTLALARKFITRKLGTFYDPSYLGSGEGGVGLYAAIDPATSRGYGGDTPRLYVIPIKAGTWMINTWVPDLEDQANAAYETSARYGCGVPAEKRGGFTDFTRSVREHEKESCRRAMIQAYTELDVGVNLYGWSSVSDLAGCRPYRPEAVVILSPRAVVTREIALYADDHVFDADPFRRHGINQLYNEAMASWQMRTVGMSGFPEKPRPRAMLTSDLTAESYLDWKSRRIAHCGPEWSFEPATRAITQYRKAMKQFYLDDESRNLVAEAGAAWLAKAKNDFYLGFQPALVVAIERKIYNATFRRVGGSVTFRTFQSARDMMGSGPADRVARIGQMIGEKLGPDLALNQSLVTQLSSSVLNHVAPTPDALPQLLRTLGAGPRWSLLLAQTELMDNGLVPFVTPLPANGIDAGYLETNRAAYRQILRECLAVYRDPKVSFERIQSGPCAKRKQQMEWSS